MGDSPVADQLCLEIGELAGTLLELGASSNAGASIAAADC